MRSWKNPSKYMFALVNKCVYYHTELVDQQGSEIHENHFLLKVHFEYGKFAPFSQEVKDLSSLNPALVYFSTLAHNEMKRVAVKILPCLFNCLLIMSSVLFRILAVVNKTEEKKQSSCLSRRCRN